VKRTAGKVFEPLLARDNYARIRNESDSLVQTLDMKAFVKKLRYFSKLVAKPDGWGC
jgi:hypothetical protein